MSDLDTNCIPMETTNQNIADECFDSLILNATNTIRRNKKRPDAFSLYEFIYEEPKIPTLRSKLWKKNLL